MITIIHKDISDNENTSDIISFAYIYLWSVN